MREPKELIEEFKDELTKISNLSEDYKEKVGIHTSKIFLLALDYPYPYQKIENDDMGCYPDNINPQKAKIILDKIENIKEYDSKLSAVALAICLYAILRQKPDGSSNISIIINKSVVSLKEDDYSQDDKNIIETIIRQIIN